MGNLSKEILAKREMVAETAPQFVADVQTNMGKTFEIAHDPANANDVPKTDAELRAERMDELEQDDKLYNLKRARLVTIRQETIWSVSKTNSILRPPNQRKNKEKPPREHSS